jgi:hypothetical protein
MNINNIKANYLKANKRNYYLFNGYHITKLNKYYLLTWLYNDMKFNTLKDLKQYIKNN